MVNESFEHFRREKPGTRYIEENSDSEKNKKNKPDTLFYEKFDHKKSERERIQLNRVEEAAEQQEAFKERFAELAILLESGSIDTNVDIAGERHWMQMDKFLKDGNGIDSDQLVNDVSRGQSLNNVSLSFNLEKTEQRPENLIIKLELPVTGVLRGGGELKKRLYEEITDIFAGSTIHDRAVRDQELKAPAEEEPLESIVLQEEEIKRNLRQKGGEIAEIRQPNKITIVVNFPKTEKQVIISRYGNKLPWYISLLNKKNTQNSFITGQPEEVLPEVTRFIEPNQ